MTRQRVQQIIGPDEGVYVEGPGRVTWKANKNGTRRFVPKFETGGDDE